MRKLNRCRGMHRRCDVDWNRKKLVISFRNENRLIAFRSRTAFCRWIFGRCCGMYNAPSSHNKQFVYWQRILCGDSRDDEMTMVNNRRCPSKFCLPTVQSLPVASSKIINDWLQLAIDFINSVFLFFFPTRIFLISLFIDSIDHSMRFIWI